MSDLQLGHLPFQLGHWHVKINTTRCLRCSASSLNPSVCYDRGKYFVKGKHSMFRKLIVCNYLRCERSRVPNLRYVWCSRQLMMCLGKGGHCNTDSVQLPPEIHKHSKHLGATSKFYAPEGCHEPLCCLTLSARWCELTHIFVWKGKTAVIILKILGATVQNSVAPGDQATGICAKLTSIGV